MSKYFIAVLMLLLLMENNALGQKNLQITINRFNNIRIFEVHNYETLEYKLKGDLFYRKNKIAVLQDSFIVFTNDSILQLNDIKAIRLNKHVSEISLLHRFFVTLGVGFFGLNSVNNMIMDNPPVIDGVAAGISAGLITTGFLIKQLAIKRVRINRNKTLRIAGTNYTQMN